MRSNVRSHAVERWAERTGSDPKILRDAWDSAVYQGHCRIVTRRGSRVVYGYRWKDWVFITVYRPGNIRAHRPETVDVISVWRIEWWERRVARYYGEKMKQRKRSR